MRNNSNKPVFKRNNINVKIIRYNISDGSIEFAKKLGKSKSQKLF